MPQNGNTKAKISEKNAWTMFSNVPNDKKKPTDYALEVNDFEKIKATKIECLSMLSR